MDELYEDLHWLILITGHVLCMESEGETALIPLEITRCSMKQVCKDLLQLLHISQVGNGKYEISFVYVFFSLEREMLM